MLLAWYKLLKFLIPFGRDEAPSPVSPGRVGKAFLLLSPCRRAHHPLITLDTLPQSAVPAHEISAASTSHLAIKCQGPDVSHQHKTTRGRQAEKLRFRPYKALEETSC